MNQPRELFERRLLIALRARQSGLATRLLVNDREHELGDRFNLMAVCPEPIQTPYKKPQGGELSAEQKEENKRLLSQHVRVEHGIRRIKAFRILRDEYRHAMGLFPMVASAVVGLIQSLRV